MQEEFRPSVRGLSSIQSPNLRFKVSYRWEWRYETME